MHLFLKRSLIFAASLLLIFIGALIFVYRIVPDPTTANDVLYRFQVEKIKTSELIKTLFIGDSSLGNSIDAQYYSQLSSSPSVNLALTGSYGFAGSYNMLKKCYSSHPEIKTVVLVQTLDVLTRPSAYKGYAYTISSWNDIRELPIQEELLTLWPLLDIGERMLSNVKILLGAERPNNSLIINDYVRQHTHESDPPEKEHKPLQFSWIEPGQIQFLRRMVSFCEANHIDLIYVHGPLSKVVAAQSKDYVSDANRVISSTGIRLIDHLVTISDDDIGDSPDHVKPEAKNKYTTIYAELLKPFIRK